jgi:hypothetical protein
LSACAFYAQVTEDDLLPINVCTSCVSKLEICHELVINCLDADARLRSILGFDVMPTDEVKHVLFWGTYDIGLIMDAQPATAVVLKGDY